MKYNQLQEGLYINEINVKTNSLLTIIRKGKRENDYFILNFHLSPSCIQQTMKEKEYTLGFKNINILLSSATTEATITIPFFGF